MKLTREQLDKIAAEDQRKYDEYLVCQKRGHTPSGYVTTGVPPKQQCRWCGTMFWQESVSKESGAPGLGPSQEFMTALIETNRKDTE